MVSYYNPATVAMFSRTGSAHHYHHHHSPPSQNHYFGPASAAAAAYGGYHHPHGHPHPHQQGSGSSPVAVGSGIGVGSALGVTSTQFSPNMTADFNCNHPQYHPHQFSNMTPDPMAGASWHQSSIYSSACAARNAAALGVPPHPSTYDEWSSAAAVSAVGHHAHMHPHHPSFYHHTQPSPPSSTPSPNSSHPGGSHSPHNQIYTTNSTTPNSNNNNNASSPFKTEFGPCSGGNPQENSSQEMSGQVVVTSGPSIGTPHSPDSGMAISDGVSSSGSPATGQQYQNNCLGGPSSTGNGNNPTSTNDNNNNGALLGAGSQQNPMLFNHGSHHQHHHQGGNNLNQMSVVSHHQSPISGRPTQARSPYEWMKKPSYSVGSSTSSNNAKTRTKDKYRVVYSDTQRLELEKEFHYSRYITIRRKSELASILGLSERQVKIWFQNRRAKERKIVRKREEMINREKIATMVHMQSAAMGGNPMCNQGNGGIPLM